MDTVGLRELSHHTSRYVSRVKSGRTLQITEHGRVVAVMSPAGRAYDESRAPRPRLGGYRSSQPLTAEEVDAELARGFGADDRR